MKNEIELIKAEIIKIFFKDHLLEILPIETPLGNELLQRILDAVHEFESNYEN